MTRLEITNEISTKEQPKLVSLLTDFGNKDYYVGSLKAHLLNDNNDISIIDISHEIETHDIVKAAFFLNNYYQDFAEGSIHIVAVNNSYDFDPQTICFEHNNHFFIGPNNGIFSLVFNNLDQSKIRLVQSIETDLHSLNQILSYTTNFILNYKSVEKIGVALNYFDQKLSISPVINQKEIRASVVHVDHYENVIVNLKKDDFEKHRNNRDFLIYIKPTDPIENISTSYAEVQVGEPLCIFNELGYLSIAINMGKASSMYSLERNDTIQILFQ